MGTVVMLIRKDELIRQLVERFEGEWETETKTLEELFQVLFERKVLTREALQWALSVEREKIEAMTKEHFKSWQQFVVNSRTRPYGLFAKINSIPVKADRKIVSQLVAWCHHYAPAG